MSGFKGAQRPRKTKMESSANPPSDLIVRALNRIAAAEEAQAEQLKRLADLAAAGSAGDAHSTDPRESLAVQHALDRLAKRAEQH